MNFDNEKSRQHRELAAEDIESAKELFTLIKDVKYQNDKSTVKGLKRKVVQNAMESTEHSFKAVNCAIKSFLIMTLKNGNGYPLLGEFINGGYSMNYAQVEKKLKFKNPKLDDKGETVYFTREFESPIGIVQVYYNRGWKYDVFINAHDKDRYTHEYFGKKKKLIDFLTRIEVKYVQKYWDY